MTVTMKGGTSGCRHDYRAQVPDSGASQPVLNTASNSSTSYGVAYPAKGGTHPFEQLTPDFMPEGGSIPADSTDVADQGA